MSNLDVTIVSFPRSGSTWMSRLLADALDSEFKGFGDALPIGAEGNGRPGKYTIRQLHLLPTYGEKDARGFLISGWECAVNNWNGDRVVHMIRDPRDIAVSAKYYWGRDILKDIILAMFNGTEPFEGVGAYHLYVKSWLEAAKDIPVYPVNFEILHANTVMVLMSLLAKMQIPNDDRGDLIKTVERQEIEAKRKQIEGENSNDRRRPYNKGIQLKHLRKGVPDEWKHEFTDEDGGLMDDLFHDIMVELGYLREGDHEWFKKLRARN